MDKIRRIIDPAGFRSGDFLQAELQAEVIREQNIGQGEFRCSYCGDPHRFQVHCGDCQATFPAAMVMFQDEPAIPGFLIMAGFCFQCKTVNILSGACPNENRGCLFEADPV